MPQHTFDLNDICNIIDKELKPNTVSIGIDGAQHITGICVLRTTKTKLYVDAFYEINMKGTGKGNLHKQLPEYYAKFLDVKKSLPDYIDYFKTVIIEDCWFGSSVWTTKILAKYSVISFLTFHDWANHIPEPIQPVSIRARVGFKKDTKSKMTIKEQIQDWIEDKFELIIEDDNYADAFILALGGLISVK